MMAAERVYELCVDADLVALAAHATFQDITDPEFLGHLLNFDGLALVGEGGVSSDNKDAGQLRKICDQI